MRDFQTIALSPAGLDPAIAIAASRSGSLGLLNLEYEREPGPAREAIERLIRFTDGRTGIKVDGHATTLIDTLAGTLPAQIEVVLLVPGQEEQLAEQVARLATEGREIWLEVTSVDQARRAATLPISALVAKGHEAGGWIGDETSFILVQRLLRESALPIHVHGGIGRHSAAACYAAGAAGVLLDHQLLLTRESQLPETVRRAIRGMDGSETTTLGGELGRTFRCFSRPGAGAVDRMGQSLLDVFGQEDPAAATRAWQEELVALTGWGDLNETLWPLGQDACFAAALAARYHTVGGVLNGIRQSARAHTESARQHRPLAEKAPLAESHGTRYPIVQGPMTRVSDRAEFCAAVADAGALPFLALALMRAPAVETLLQETATLMEGRPWGVGILGFVPLDLRKQQLAEILRVRPPFAIIAGGRPDQAQRLEKEGIATYLHVPSPGLLRLFLNDGARRFIFEGRECGGHVGPRASFVLWNTMVEEILEQLPARQVAECHILFAGGIHDDLSAAMVAALAAPLAAAGARIGVLMGTAYLFTEEAVEAQAILPGFQEAAIACDRTVLLESGPGHATRAVESPFVTLFEEEKLRLRRSGLHSEDVRQALEELNIGRLRIASKGITRHPQFGQDPSVPKYVEVDAAGQQQEGMYMIGQVAALRKEATTMAALHQQVSVGSVERLARQVQIEAGDERRPPVRPSQVAIVGMSTILPKAPDMATFWDNVLNGVYAIGEVPKERWDADLFFDEDKHAPDKIYSRWGGFLQDVPFDPLDFGMPPTSLPSVDPMHLLGLVATREALRDAGYDKRPFNRKETSVILGASGGVGDLGAGYILRTGLPLLFGEQGFAMAREAGDLLPEWTEDSFAGLLLNVAAGRIANRFDFGGLNYIVDAACASSLTAVHLAVKELETYNTDVVIAGGVDTVQNPFGFLCFSKTQALSPRGRPRTFDADGDGIAISEGVVMLVLKRLEDAERDGDRIYAVIQGVGASSDGKGLGMTAPRPEGQVLALERAYRKAGFSATTVGLFEAHGTGTAVGDRTEALSLTRFLEDEGADADRYAIGSVKSMIGHTKASAGVAGVAKLALSLYHKVLPPTLGVTRPNPKARFGDGPLYVNAELRPWIQGVQDHPRRAGVSAFGFGGTNFHAVLEEYTGDFLPSRRTATARDWPTELLLWAAPSRERLRAAVAQSEQALADGAAPRLADLSYSLWQKARSVEGGVRLAIVAGTVEELQQRLAVASAALAAEGPVDLSDPRGIYVTEQPLGADGDVAFLFPGQGSQYPNMLRDLAIHFDVVRETLEGVDAALAGQYDRPLSSYIYPNPAFDDETRQAQQAALTETLVAQPALGATSMAMYRLLEGFALRPRSVAGHSYGEYAALCAAGVIDLPAMARLSEARGRAIVTAATEDLGGMAAVRADERAVRAALDGLDGVWIANLNAPTQTIISGRKRALKEAGTRLAAAGLAMRPIEVSCAFHSPLVAPAQSLLAGALDNESFETPERTVYSNTTASAYPEGPEAIRALLADHLVKPVRFSDEIEAMYEAGHRLFVEVGPRSALTGLTGRILDNRPHLAVAADHPRQHGLTRLQHLLGQLAAHGVPLDLSPLFQGRPTRTLALHRLVEESRPVPHTPTTWLVDGSRARPHTKPAHAPAPPLAGYLDRPAAPSAPAPAPAAPPATPDAPAPARPSATQPAPPAQAQPVRAAAPSAAPAAAPAARPATPAPAAGGGSGQAVVMDHFQQMMSRFLETHRGVMASYLGGAVPPTPAPATRPTPARPAAIPSGSAAPNGLVRANGTVSSPAPTPQHAAAPPRTAAVQPPVQREAESTNGHHVEAVARFTMHPVDRPVGAEAPLAPGQVALLTDDGGGVATELAARLEAAGHPAVLLRHGAGRDADGIYHIDLTDAAAVAALADRLQSTVGPVAALVHLLPLGGALNFESMSLEEWQARLALESRALFLLSQSFGPSLLAAAEKGGGAILGVSGMGGSFGVGVSHTFFPGQGGMTGFLKCLALEWPALRVRAVDVEPRDGAAAIATALLQEMRVLDDRAEIGYQGGRRMALEPFRDPHGGHATAALDEGAVLLVTGGARGITAEVALEMARRYRPILVLAGRSPLPDEEESPETAGIEAPAELKRRLIARLQSDGRRPALPEVERAYQRLLKAREMRRNLRAMVEAGATVHYFSGDVRDEESFGALIESIYDSFGRLDGVIHGAGVIEDKLVQDKQVDSFDRVVGTKVDSAFVLSRHLRPEGLRFLLFFTSVAGRFGNRGQSDYAAANEILNKMALYLDGRWPGRVLAVNWGPWKKHGMVSPEVQRAFESQGIQLILPRAGREFLADELEQGTKGQVEIVAGDGPWGRSDDLPAPARSASEGEGDGLPLIRLGTLRRAGGRVEFTLNLTLENAPYLRDHTLDGNAVAPLALAAELAAEVAQAGWPDLVLNEIEGLQMFRGIVLQEGAVTLQVSASAPQHPSAESLTLPIAIEIADAANPALPLYRATVRMGPSALTPPAFDQPPLVGLDPFPLEAQEAYLQWSFHGPCFQRIARWEGANRGGATLSLSARPPAGCDVPLPAGWLIDPILLDVAPQVALIWSRAQKGMTALPATFARYRHYARLGGSGLRLYFFADPDAEAQKTRGDFYFVDDAGRVLGRLEGLEGVCSKQLNRLMGRQVAK